MTGFIDISIISPPVVIHGFSHPLIAEILNQTVDERQSRVRGYDTSVRVLVFKTHDLR